MIEINEVSEGRFPIIDFKFQNRGKASAFLHKFVVRVLSVSIDPTPVLSHFALVRGEEGLGRWEAPGWNAPEGKFVLVARNDGWGDAHDCQVRVCSDQFEKLFSEEALRFRGKLPQGEDTDTVVLDPTTVNSDRFKRLLQSSNEIEPREGLRRRSNVQSESVSRDDAIPLSLPHFSTEFRDVNGGLHTASDRASSDLLSGFGGQLWLSPRKFFWESLAFPLMAAHCSIPSARYFVSIDADGGPQTKNYSISHSVPSGELERFQFVLGSPKSCRVRLRFAFKVDGEHYLDSEEFDVNIWAPRNSNSSSYSYQDGDELLSRSLERAAKPQAGVEARKKDKFSFLNKDWDLERILKSGFPFLRRQDDDRY